MPSDECTRLTVDMQKWAMEGLDMAAKAQEELGISRGDLQDLALHWDTRRALCGQELLEHAEQATEALQQLHEEQVDLDADLQLGAVTGDTRGGCRNGAALQPVWCSPAGARPVHLRLLRRPDCTKMTDFLTQLRALSEQVVACFDAILAQTDTEAQKRIAERPPNHQAVTNALDAVGDRLMSLQDKLFDAWWDNEDSLGDEALRTQTHEEVKAAIRGMHDKAQRQRVRLDAATAQAMWPAVLAALNAPILCTDCNAPLDRNDPLAMQTVTCPYCMAVTQVVPDPILKVFYPTMAEQLALAKHIDQAMAIKAHYRAHQDWADREERRTGERPNPPPETLAKIRELERAYYERYLDERARMMPMTDEDRQAALERFTGGRVELLLVDDTIL